jgi:hypothetical protein
MKTRVFAFAAVPKTSRAPLDRPPWNRRDGFSIAEVAIATFIMAFGIATSIIAMQAGFQPGYRD